MERGIKHHDSNWVCAEKVEQKGAHKILSTSLFTQKWEEKQHHHFHTASPLDVLKKCFQSSITQFLLPIRRQNLGTKSHRGSPQTHQDLYSHPYRQERRETQRRVCLLQAKHIHGNETPEIKGVCGAFVWVFLLLISISLREGFLAVLQKTSCFSNLSKAFYPGYDGEWKKIRIPSCSQHTHWSSSAQTHKDHVFSSLNLISPVSYFSKLKLPYNWNIEGLRKSCRIKY